jgi:6-pyruvoyltetrahydropterin/6-carboxytetrahydropterin synthase
MYTVSMRKNLISRHYLPHEQGEEGKPHPHHYRVEVSVSGKNLDEHGFLVDLVEFEKIIDNQLKVFRDKVLNELREFKGRTPSIESFSKVIWDKVVSRLHVPRINSVTVTVWEDKDVYASYQGDI